MKDFLKNNGIVNSIVDWSIENKLLIILWIICLFTLFIFTGHYSNIFLDVGREVYYPERILEGKVLYKDLFNIYGPFAYQWNALLYAILGKKLSTLYLSGGIYSIGIVSAIYLIAKKFFTQILAFAFGCLTIATGVCAPHLFNFTFPYSQAMLIGTLSALFALFFVLEFSKSKNSKYLYISALLTGLAVSCKYDFFIFAAFLFVVACFSKNIKYILNFITCFAIIPLISFGILFLQGLTFVHLIDTANVLSRMAKSNTLNYFYSSQGVFFNKQMLKLWPISALKTLLLFGGTLGGVFLFNKNKICGWVVTSIFAILTVIFTTPANFVFILPLLLLASLFSYKKFKLNPQLLILVLGTLTLSVKSFLSLTPMNYGNYCFSISLIAIFAVFYSYISEKYQKAGTIFLIATAICFFGMFSYNRMNLNMKVSVPKGTIYTNYEDGNAVLELLGYLKYKKVKDVVIYPEGLLLNFLSDTKSDDYFNSLIPLYEEVFGDERFIDYFAQKRPEYFVLANLNMKDYYYELIAVDYAIPFCKFLAAAYDPIEGIDYGRRFLIFKRN